METIVREPGKVKVAMIHPETYTFKEKYQYFYGGRGGGKTKTAARIVPLLAWEHSNLRALVARKTMPSLRVTAMEDTLKAINQMKIPGTFHASVPCRYEMQNGSRIFFIPLYVNKGRNERLKGLDLNVIWMEEPTECTKKDFDMLDPTVRLPGIHRWFFTFNPPENSDHWLYENYERQKAQGIARKTHFALDDNPLLPEDTKRELRSLEKIDYGLFLRFAEGKWGINVRRKRVWQNVHIGVAAHRPEIVVGGIDFGWSNPSSSHLYGVDDIDLYVMDEEYGSHMDTETLGGKIIAMLARNGFAPHDVCFAADSNYPEKIKELNDMGLWVVPCLKGKGSVAAGIDEVRKYAIHVDEEKCPNAWREIHGYIYPEDANGNVMEEPLKMNDHCPDELRYAVYTLLKHMQPFASTADTTPALAKSAF